MKTLFWSTWMLWRTGFLQSNRVLFLLEFVLPLLRFLSLSWSPPASTVASSYSSLSAKGNKDDTINYQRYEESFTSFRIWQEVKSEDGDRVLFGDDALRKLEERSRIWKEPRTVWFSPMDIFIFKNYLHILLCNKVKGILYIAFQR